MPYQQGHSAKTRFWGMWEVVTGWNYKMRCAKNIFGGEGEISLACEGFPNTFLDKIVWHPWQNWGGGDLVPGPHWAWHLCLSVSWTRILVFWGFFLKYNRKIVVTVTDWDRTTKLRAGGCWRFHGNSHSQPKPLIGTSRNLCQVWLWIDKIST